MPEKAIEEIEAIGQMVMDSSVAVFTSVSAGYIIWMLRGGSLLITFRASLAVCRSFDPLPVLDSYSRATGNDEFLEALVSS
ncbi:MAG: hypothetical protein MK102_19445 [Fuerstiella sp.]|nr:hypothetical protein [Fuerstiella sp.]